MENSNQVEIFTEDSIITLYDDDNNPIDFFEIASVEFEGRFYELMQPVEPNDEIEEDEAVIFEYSVDEESGDKLFKPIFDETLLENIFSLYISAAADFESAVSCGCGTDEECGSGCGCGCRDEKPAEKQVKKEPAKKESSKKDKQ